MFVPGVATGGKGGNTCDEATVMKRQYARASDATNLGIINPFMSLTYSPPASQRLLMICSAACFFPPLASSVDPKYETFSENLGLFFQTGPHCCPDKITGP
jgi:hypothetical protein